MTIMISLNRGTGCDAYVQSSKVIFFYATRLRKQCEDDPQFGYELMKIAGASMLSCLKVLQHELLKRIESD